MYSESLNPSVNACSPLLSSCDLHRKLSCHNATLVVSLRGLSSTGGVVPRELPVKPVQNQAGGNPVGSLAAAGRGPGRGSEALGGVMCDAQRNN